MGGGVSYRTILSIIRRLKQKNKDLSSNELVEMALDIHNKRAYIKKISNIFSNLKNNNITIDELKNICENLKIDFECVMRLVNINFTYVQAINTIWYFSDEENNGFLQITDSKIHKLLSFARKLQLYSDDKIDEIDLYILIGIYKSGLLDTRNLIIIKYKKYIDKIIYDFCVENNISLNPSIMEDFRSEIILYLMESIESCVMNIPKMITSYINKIIKGKFKNYLCNYKMEYNSLILSEENLDSQDKISKIDNNFSESLSDILSKLSKEDFMFVYYKYQQLYTDEQLSKFFNLDIDEINERNRNIIFYIRNYILQNGRNLSESMQKLKMAYSS